MNRGWQGVGLFGGLATVTRFFFSSLEEDGCFGVVVGCFGVVVVVVVVISLLVDFFGARPLPAIKIMMPTRVET